MTAYLKDVTQLPCNFPLTLVQLPPTQVVGLRLGHTLNGLPVLKRNTQHSVRGVPSGAYIPWQLFQLKLD